MPATPLKGARCFKPLFPDGDSPGEFFSANGSPNTPNVSLRARQLEKEIKKYMKMPPSDPQARSTPRGAARATKSPVSNNAAGTSARLQDSGDETDYGIEDFNEAGLQEVDAILDSLVNGA